MGTPIKAFEKKAEVSPAELLGVVTGRIHDA
jgi:hypothetical protein